MANENYKNNAVTGNLILEGREKLSISEVTDVLSFDEHEILCETALGALMTAGEDLHVERLSLEQGELVITGRIDLMEYVGERKQKGSFWSKLF